MIFYYLKPIPIGYIYNFSLNDYSEDRALSTINLMK